MYLATVLLFSLLNLHQIDCFPTSKSNEDNNQLFNLTILHTNDLHSNIDSGNENLQPCSEVDILREKCWGGISRLYTAVEKMRKKFPKSILLDAGDQLQGTLWYTLLRWYPTSATMNLMNYTAATLGNHEFDDGDGNLADYLKNITFPMISSNVQGDQSKISGLFQPYLIAEVSGEKLAILGYTTPDTASLSSPSDKVTFNDEIRSLKSEIEKIKTLHPGVNKFIAVGHSGVKYDQKVCAEVPEIDVVIGGHSHTLLYSGTPPVEFPASEGPYPIVVQKPDHKICLVVQAWAFSKYLGVLHVNFNKTGDVIGWHGNPVLIDASFENEPKIDAILRPLRRNLTESGTIQVVRTGTILRSAYGNCRVTECKIGNLVADSFFEYAQGELERMIAQNHNQSNQSTIVSIFRQKTPIRGLSIVNSGALRNFDVKANSTITMSMIQTLLPWFAPVKLFLINGTTLRKVIERSIANFNFIQRHGKFLQVSKNVRIEYNQNCTLDALAANDGFGAFSIKSIKIGCMLNCPPSYYSSSSNLEDLNPNEKYVVATREFVARGGDGYEMLKNGAALDLKGSDKMEIDILVPYLKGMKLIKVDLEGRLKFEEHGKCALRYSVAEDKLVLNTN